MKGLGILEVGGKEYVVLEKITAEMPSEGFLDVMNRKGDAHFVARRFSTEQVKFEDMGAVVYQVDEFYTPRWMTIHGDYVINWFPEPIEVNVEDTWIKQETK